MHGLEPRRLAADDVAGAFGDAERLAEQGDNRRIGLALVGHRPDADAGHGGAVIADLDALEAIEPGIGRDAEEERQPVRLDPVGKRRSDG